MQNRARLHVRKLMEKRRILRRNTLIKGGNSCQIRVLNKILHVSSMLVPLGYKIRPHYSRTTQHGMFVAGKSSLSGNRKYRTVHQSS